MKLSELNPVFSGKQLVLTCPQCKKDFTIDINYQGDPIPPSTWGMKHPHNKFDWDFVTLSPSIANHPQSKKLPKCNFHFSVINGEIIP